MIFSGILALCMAGRGSIVTYIVFTESRGGQGDMYDVIVIGAGPAGATAAKTLAEGGCKTLLAERSKMPRYKSCSGQLIRKTLDLVEACYGEPVPRSAMCTPTENRGVILTDDRGNTFRFEQHGRNVWRSDFDKWLADKAASVGVEVRDETAAIACDERDGIVNVTLKNGGRTYTEQARYVIDCEGVTGTLKRKLTGKEPEYITTYQTYNQGTIDLDPHYFYAWLQPDLSQYDAWFNVKDGQLVVGVSVQDSYRIPAYFCHFIAYMQKNHGLRIEKQLKEDRWLMHRVRPGCTIDYGVGRVFFAGEAAGLLNPMGEGVSSAIESGHQLAGAILDHFDDPKRVLAAYQDAVKPLQDYMKRQWHLVSGMSDAFRDMRLSGEAAWSF